MEPRTRLILSPPRTAETWTRVPLSTLPSLKHPAVGNVVFVPVVYTPPVRTYTVPVEPVTNATQIWVVDNVPSERWAVTNCTSSAQLRLPQFAVVSHCA